MKTRTEKLIHLKIKHDLNDKDIAELTKSHIRSAQRWLSLEESTVIPSFKLEMIKYKLPEFLKGKE